MNSKTHRTLKLSAGVKWNRTTAKILQLLGEILRKKWGGAYANYFHVCNVIAWLQQHKAL